MKRMASTYPAMSWEQSNIILLIAFYTAAAVHFHTTCATLILSLMKQDLSTSEDFNQDEMLDKLYGGNKKLKVLPYEGKSLLSLLKV